MDIASQGRCLAGFYPLRHADGAKVAKYERALGGHAKYWYNAIEQGVIVEDCVSSATAYVVGKPLGRVPQTPCLMSRAGKLKAMGAGCDFL